MIAHIACNPTIPNESFASSHYFSISLSAASQSISSTETTESQYSHSMIPILTSEGICYRLDSTYAGKVLGLFISDFFDHPALA
jgi:hypothetical protein